MTNQKNLSASWNAGGAATRRVEKHIAENIGEAHSRQIDTSDQENNIDPAKFTEAQLYGMTRRQVWIRHNASEFKVPEIVGHIIKNWNKQDWLISLLKRYGLEFDLKKDNIFIYEIWPHSHNVEALKVDLLRKFLLRLSGLTIREIRNLTDIRFVDIQSEYKMFAEFSELALQKIKEADKKRKAKSGK